MKYLAFLILLSFSCATAPAPPAASTLDPLGVAERWVEYPTEAPEFAAAWSGTGQVARIYKEGEQFMALVVGEDVAEIGPAVRLTISKTAAGFWEVSAVEEAESSLLFPVF